MLAVPLTLHPTRLRVTDLRKCFVPETVAVDSLRLIGLARSPFEGCLG